MIEAKDIHKYYENLHVLRGVNLLVERGEIISIVGKSGAGKSTLLHILGTLDDADSGQVIINGRNIQAMNKLDLANFRNQEIGFIFQFHHLLPEFDALENVCIPAFIHNADESKTKSRAKELLEYLGLGDRLDHRPGQLSGGEQQRVAVARALINNPSVIFADEPSGNLDTVSSSDLHDLMFKLRKDFQQTFVIVTHNPELAEMSDRTLTIKDGQIV
ncbi:MAG: ABC transporter ATP-binding protein [Bacteroidia bacterium]|nr:ABC transporter ATP-binding protein [Bacteroidia bacterium]